MSPDWLWDVAGLHTGLGEPGQAALSGVSKMPMCSGLGVRWGVWGLGWTFFLVQVSWGAGWLWGKGRVSRGHPIAFWVMLQGMACPVPHGRATVNDVWSQTGKAGLAPKAPLSGQRLPWKDYPLSSVLSAKLVCVCAWQTSCRNSQPGADT